MEDNFKDPEQFMVYLNAFLASGRSVTQLFKKEFNDNKELMNYYESKTVEWKKNEVTRLFVWLRNISLKEHTPNTRISVAKSLSSGFNISQEFA